MRPKKILFALLVSYVIVLAVNLSSNFNYYAHGGKWSFSVFFSLGVTTLGVLGGIMLYHLVFRKFNWLERSTLKLLAGVLIFAAYGLTLMVVSVRCAEVLLHINYEHDNFVVDCTYAVLFSMIIGLIMSGRSFLTHLKKSIEDNERMKQAMIQSQYETLKSQVNPHFLFNSLNTLTVMISQQPDVAVQFVEQMAKVFRYSLQHSNEQTVDVATELKVVKSYLFLNEQRFNGKLKVDIRVDNNVLQQKIITHSLLILVENAIKHNEISSEHPLSVNIYSEGNYLVAANTLQRKQIMEQSTKMGLENIKKRYELVSGKPVIIEEGNLFTVKIPLL